MLKEGFMYVNVIDICIELVDMVYKSVVFCFFEFEEDLFNLFLKE